MHIIYTYLDINLDINILSYFIMYNLNIFVLIFLYY